MYDEEFAINFHVSFHGKEKLIEHDVRETNNYYKLSFFLTLTFNYYKPNV